MTDRERLIKLYDNFTDTHPSWYAEELADYILANGVIVPPCKVGDYVLWDNGLKDSKPTMKEVKGLYYNSENLGLRYILEDCQLIVNFSAIVGILTKEEAEAKLKEREG
jgi:hypothetical protein